MFKVTKSVENDEIVSTDFKFKTREEAEQERIRLIEEEGLSDLSVIVESDEYINEANKWIDKIVVDE